MGIIYVWPEKDIKQNVFSNEIQGGLGPGVCCPKTIVQATSKMKNRFKQGYLDKAAPKKTHYNKVDGGARARMFIKLNASPCWVRARECL